MNLDLIVEKEKNESSLAYSPPIVTALVPQNEQQTLACILWEMEMSRRETFDQ